MKISDEGSASYGNGREAPNDDLVLACAMGCYVATRPAKSARMVAGGRLGQPERYPKPTLPDQAS